MCTAIYIFVSIIFITIKLHILLLTLKIMSYGRANFSKKKKKKEYVVSRGNILFGSIDIYDLVILTFVFI